MKVSLITNIDLIDATECRQLYRMFVCFFSCWLHLSISLFMGCLSFLAQLPLKPILYLFDQLQSIMLSNYRNTLFVLNKHGKRTNIKKPTNIVHGMTDIISSLFLFVGENSWWGTGSVLFSAPPQPRWYFRSDLFWQLLMIDCWTNESAPYFSQQLKSFTNSDE